MVWLTTACLHNSYSCQETLGFSSEILETNQKQLISSRQKTFFSVGKFGDEGICPVKVVLFIRMRKHFWICFWCVFFLLHTSVCLQRDTEMLYWKGSGESSWRQRYLLRTEFFLYYSPKASTEMQFFFIQLKLHIWGQGISRLLQKLVSTLLAWVVFIHPKNNFMLDKKSSAEKIIAWTRWFYANNLFLSNTKSEDWKTANLHLLWISHVKVVLTIPLECCHARRSRHLVKKPFYLLSNV